MPNIKRQIEFACAFVYIRRYEAAVRYTPRHTCVISFPLFGSSRDFTIERPFRLSINILFTPDYRIISFHYRCHQQLQPSFVLVF